MACNAKAGEPDLGNTRKPQKKICKAFYRSPQTYNILLSLTRFQWNGPLKHELKD